MLIRAYAGRKANASHKVLTGIRSIRDCPILMLVRAYSGRKANAKRRVLTGTRNVIDVRASIVDAQMQARRPVQSVECSMAL